MTRWLLWGFAFVLTGCAHTVPTTTSDDESSEIAAMMIGDFAADPTRNGNDFLDRRRALAPLGDGSWVYLQLNSGPERKLYRQRVLQLVTQDDGSVLQNTYSLASPADKRNLIRDPTRLASLTLDDLTATLNDNCDVIWRRATQTTNFAWRGVVSPDRCVIYSDRRQTNIRIGAESKLSDDALWQAERGLTMDSELLWGTPVGDFTQLNRIDDSAQP